jgi:hypothetical protein
MAQQKEFMLLFRFEPSNDQQPTEAQLNEQQQLWGQFIGGIALQEKFVSTSQLGFEGNQVLANKSIVEGIHVGDGQVLGGNMVVRANSLEEATQMAMDCPILLMGGSAEIREIIPM